MHSDLFIAIEAGLGGMLGWGLADFFAKKTIDAIGDVTTLFWSQLLGVVPLLFWCGATRSAPSFPPAQWGILAVLGIWSGLSYIPTYVAFGKGQVSLLSPIFASYAVVVAILSAVLLHETIPPERWIAFAVVFGGVLLISGDPQALRQLYQGRSPSQWQSISGLKEVLLAIVLYSVWLIALDREVNGRNWPAYLLVIRLFSAASLWIYCRLTRRALAIGKTNIWPFLLLVGLFDVAAFASVTYGFSATPHASIVAMLSGAFSLPTMLLAKWFLGERSTRLQTVGSLVTVAGIMLLAVL